MPLEPLPSTLTYGFGFLIFKKSVVQLQLAYNIVFVSGAQHND